MAIEKRFVVEYSGNDADPIDSITNALSDAGISAYIYEIDENGEPVG
jgi:hypothetical protein